MDHNNNLLAVTLKKWDLRQLSEADPARARFFPLLAQQLHLTYDGAKTPKVLASTFRYDEFGNLIQEIDFGEVTLAAAPYAFSDTAADKITITKEYARNARKHLVALPARRVRTDFAGKVLGEQKFYYDNLALGAVAKGNQTKLETRQCNVAAGCAADSYQVTQTEYNELGLPLTQTNSRGYATTLTYAQFNLYPRTITNAKQQVRTYVYDYRFGKPTQVTDPNGRVQQVTFESLGRPLKQQVSKPEDPTQLVTLVDYTYSLQEVPAKIQTTTYAGPQALAITTATYLDGFGRTLQIRTEAEGANKYVVRNFAYDWRGRLTKEFLPQFGPGVNFSAGELSQPGTAFSYDALGRLTAAKNSLGTVTTTYKPWEQTIVDLNGQRKDLVFDARGNLVEVREYLATRPYSTFYEYDGNQHLTRITDAQGNLQNFTVDLLGRRTKAELLHTPGAKEVAYWEFEYDANGNKTKTRDPRGQVLTFSYDELDRVLREESATEGRLTSYQYDTAENGIGRLAAVSTPVLRKNFTYDILGRIIQAEKILAGVSYVTQTTFNLLDNPRQITYPSGPVIHYRYNKAGLTEAVTTMLAGKTKVIVANLDYAPTGAYQKIEFGNGVITEHTYDLNQLYRLTQKRTSQGTRLLQDLAYTFDPVGNIVKLVENSATRAARVVQYAYDDLYRLTAAVATRTANKANYTRTYSYDILGNLLSKSAGGTYTYAGSHPHAVTQVTRDQEVKTRYQYDAAGNLTRAGDWQHTWDAQNRLVTSTNAQTGVTLSYTYDETKTRLRKANLKTGTQTIYVNKYLDIEEDLLKHHIFVGELKLATLLTGGTENAPGGSCTLPKTGTWNVRESCRLEGFYSAPADVLVQPKAVLTIEPQAVLTLDFTQHKLQVAPEGGVLLQPGGTLTQAGYLPKSEGSLIFHHADHLSGASVETDETGRILELLDYFPFGAVRLDEQTGPYANDYKFTGQELDAETQLYYYGARYYAAELGRFTAIDPWEGELKQPQTLNKYAYVVNNPLKYVDPSGEVLETFWDIGNVGSDIGRGLLNVGELIVDGLNYTTGVVTGNEDLQQAAINSVQENLKDLGEVVIDTAADAAATMIPFVPAGTTKAVRGGRKQRSGKRKSKN